METMILSSLTSASARKVLFEDLYKQAFPVVARFVSKSGGSFQDARDIFHDALVIYVERRELNDIEHPDRYITGIAKHLWLRKYEKNKYHVRLDDYENALTIPSDYFPTVSSARLLRFLQSTGNKCLELLRSFYFDNVSMKKLAENFGYSSERSATVQKFKCIEKLRESIKEKSATYEDFFE